VYEKKKMVEVFTGKSGIKHQKLISGDHGDRGSLTGG